MTRLEFDQMVEQLELRYQNRGPALTRVAVGWAILGYAVLVIALGLTPTKSLSVVFQAAAIFGG